MLPIKYGWCFHAKYISEEEAIAQDVAKGNMLNVVKKINAYFFKGGVFAIKSFSDLASVKMPKLPLYISRDSAGTARVEITTQTSISAILGYIEAIPVIGSVQAIINV